MCIYRYFAHKILIKGQKIIFLFFLKSKVMSNIYIKIKTIGIKPADWEKAWQEMLSLVEAIPCELLRKVNARDSEYDCDLLTPLLIRSEEHRLNSSHGGISRMPSSA